MTDHLRRGDFFGGDYLLERHHLADELASPLVSALKSGRSVAAYTARGRATAAADPERTRALGHLFARLFRRAVAETGIRRVALAGGDSSSYAKTSIGA